LIIPEEIINETERRYRRREPEREAIWRKIDTGDLASANEPDRFQKRLFRVARAQSAHGEAAPDPTLNPASDDASLERVFGKNVTVSIAYLDLARRASRTVGRIRIQTPEGYFRGYATGFMVGPRLLLTNHHVLTDRNMAVGSQIDFNYQESLSGINRDTTTFSLQPDSFFMTDQALDYTLVAVQETSLDGQTSLSTFGWLPLIEDQGKILLGEYSNIIQHPNGEPKRISLRKNLVIDLFDDFLHYETESTSGSSGSPMLNDQWEVVALHHSGVPARDEQDHILTTDNTIWTEDLGEHRVKWIANEGLRVSRIVRHIKAQTLSAEAAELRSAMFETNATILPPETDHAHIGVPASVQTDRSGDRNTITLTIPLSVTVDLRQATPSARVTTQSTYLPDGPGPGRATIKRELDDALGELEAGRRQVYYNRQSDQTDVDAYYQAISDQLDPTALFTVLSSLLRTTHTTRIKYKPIVHVYPWIDLHPDNKLRSIYSDKVLEPEATIREDLRISQERAIRLQGLMQAETILSIERAEEQLDFLERALPFNCEHVVPQSWFDKREPMRGDLHHLFTCENNCNSFRGNTPYFDFPDFEEAIRSDCGKRIGKSFEPSAGKGPIARATLYFLLRYPGEVNDIANELSNERLDILLNWHQSNPVTDYERHRNMAIFAKQGNRNPLIDFPGWAEKIDFSRGLG
jgi:endonuclease G, mitochondrial